MVRYFYMDTFIIFVAIVGIIRCMCNVYLFVFYEYYAIIIFYFITVC